MGPKLDLTDGHRNHQWAPSEFAVFAAGAVCDTRHKEWDSQASGRPQGRLRCWMLLRGLKLPIGHEFLDDSYCMSEPKEKPGIPGQSRLAKGLGPKGRGRRFPWRAGFEVPMSRWPLPQWLPGQPTSEALIVLRRGWVSRSRSPLSHQTQKLITSGRSGEVSCGSRGQAPSP